MTTVVLEVRSLRDALSDASRVIKSGKAERDARIGFASPELLWEVLTAKRWELLKALCGAGAMSIREAARRVAREAPLLPGVAPGWVFLPVRQTAASATAIRNAAKGTVL